MLYKNKFNYLLILIVALCFNLSFAAKKPLTPEQQALKNKLRAERIKKSEAADKLIRHSTIEEFKSTVITDPDNLWIVFYGSKKCPHTQKFNPKWLQFQQNMDNGLYNLENVKITKIECYGNQFDFCVSQGNQYWPELMFYYKGVKKGVYDGEDEIEDILKFVQDKKSKFMKESKKVTKTVKEVKSGLPTKKPTPPKKPTKQPPAKQTKQPPVKQTKQPKQPIVRPTKNPPTAPKTIPVPPPQPPKNVEEIDNSIDIDNDNAISEVDGDDNIGFDNTINEEYNYIDEPKESSHVVAYSVGGFAAFSAIFLFTKKRFRGHGYARVGSSDRNPHMKYKYDKHIV